MPNMVQYGVWPNCCNACDFCLREERIPYSKDKQLYWLNQIIKNLDYVDFKISFLVVFLYLVENYIMLRMKIYKKNF